MEKKNIFWVIITIILASLIFLLAIKLIFKSDSINEGKFRVSDVILTSSAVVENKTEVNETWSIDLSQKNKLSMLITVGDIPEIKSMMLKDIYVDKENIVLSQSDNENKIILSETNNKLDLEYNINENGQILIELEFLNENILKNWTIPNGTDEIIYDGRIFKFANMDIEDLQFRINFKLEITEAIGKTNILNVKLNLPYSELLTNGADIRRLPLSEFRFKVI